MPFFATSTIATISDPSDAIQCSVIDDSNSSIEQEHERPDQRRPKTVPMPPRMTITTSSPDIVQAQRTATRTAQVGEQEAGDAGDDGRR